MDTNAQSIYVLAADVANQITRFGLFCEDELLATWSITTPSHLTTDEAWLAVITFLNKVRDEKLPGIQPQSIKPVLSCVVPDLTNTWSEALRSIGNQRPLVVGPGVKTGIQMNYNDPSEMGSDRIADIVAAKKLYGYPLIIIDCGTTINYQVLDSAGIYVGGLIVPGLRLSARILAEAAARLPRIELRIPTGVLGKNTQESLQSGIIRGEVARINGLIEMIWQELTHETAIVLAGEDAALLAPLLDHDAQIADNLTLIGLSELYKMNRK